MPNRTANDQQTFLLNLLKAIHQKQEVHILLENNLDKLNDEFALLLRQWSIDRFAKEPKQAVNIARLIIELSRRLQNYEKGNPTNNIEIAIAGYEVVLQSCKRDAFPKDWDNIQKQLIAAYRQHQKMLFATISKQQQTHLQIQNKTNNITEYFQKELEYIKQQFEALNITVTQLGTQVVNPEPSQEINYLISEFRELKQRQSILENFSNQIHFSHVVEQFNIGIFYDIENLTMGTVNPVFQHFSLHNIQHDIEKLSKVNKISVQRAYADWSNSKLRRLKSQTQELGIETVQIFDFGYKKNAADIQLAIDVMELVHSRPALQVFVIVSGDGAFASLAKKLHEYAKTVIGCGYQKHTNQIFATVCDQFIWLPEPDIEKKDEKLNIVKSNATGELEEVTRDDKYVLNYLKNQEPYCTLLRQDGMNLQNVRDIFVKLIPSFNHKQYGFAKFKQYLKHVCQDTEYEVTFLNGDRTKSILKIRYSHAQKSENYILMNEIAAS
jgi:uncharacterized LabA/DUF88 family protein